MPFVLAAVGAGLFCQAFVRLRHRGRRDHAGWDRAVLFAAALAIGLVALSPPLDRAAEETLSAHMLQHVLVGDLVPALIVVSLRGPLLVFVLPSALLSRLSRARLLRVAARVLVRPPFAFAGWATVLGLWHVPVLYDSVLERPLVHELEHSAFFLTGLLVWAVLVEPGRRSSRALSARLGFAGALFACGQALGNVLVLASSSYYPAYGSVSDQRTAGLVMMGEQLLTLGTFAALQVRLWLRAPLAAEQAQHPFLA